MEIILSRKTNKHELVGDMTGDKQAINFKQNTFKI